MLSGRAYDYAAAGSHLADLKTGLAADKLADLKLRLGKLPPGNVVGDDQKEPEPAPGPKPQPETPEVAPTPEPGPRGSPSRVPNPRPLPERIAFQGMFDHWSPRFKAPETRPAPTLMPPTPTV